MSPDAPLRASMHRLWLVYCSQGLSKLALIAASNVLAQAEPQLRVNACCPGYCDTDMSSHKGPRPPEVGARNALMLILSPRDQCPTGAFYENEAPSTW